MILEDIMKKKQMNKNEKIEFFIGLLLVCIILLTLYFFLNYVKWHEDYFYTILLKKDDLNYSFVSKSLITVRISL